MQDGICGPKFAPPQRIFTPASKKARIASLLASEPVVVRTAARVVERSP
jgi:hypothetical protein